MIQPDEELVAAAQAGDHTALSTLYDRHFTKLYRFIYRHVQHQRHCSCRPMPELVKKAISNQKNS